MLNYEDILRFHSNQTNWLKLCEQQVNPNLYVRELLIEKFKEPIGITVKLGVHIMPVFLELPITINITISNS